MCSKRAHDGSECVRKRSELNIYKKSNNFFFMQTMAYSGEWLLHKLDLLRSKKWQANVGCKFRCVHSPYTCRQKFRQTTWDTCKSSFTCLFGSATGSICHFKTARTEGCDNKFFFHFCQFPVLSGNLSSIWAENIFFGSSRSLVGRERQEASNAGNSWHQQRRSD